METASALSRRRGLPTASATGESGDIAIEIEHDQRQGQEQPLYGERRAADDAAGVAESSDREDNSPSHDDYVPIDGAPPGYPALDFRPISLQNWFLALTIGFFALCFAAVITLTVISHYQPNRLHLVRKTSHVAVSYTPGIVGTITTVWFTAVVQTYNRIIPYATMASTPRNISNQERVMYDLNALAILSFRPGVVWNLLQHGHWMTFMINTTLPLLIVALTPLKSGFIQITEDSQGWATHISRGIGYALCALYALLMTCMSGMFWQLWGVPTGLKWDPAPIAAQIALVTRSNIFSAFRGMEFLPYKRISGVISEWGQSNGVLRLGYWQHKDEERKNDIVHGVLFYRLDGGPRSPESGLQARLDADGEPIWRHPLHRYPDYCLEHPYSLEAAPLTRRGTLVCSPQYLRYRIGHFYFSTWWCWPPRVIGLVCLVVAIRYMINGRVSTPVKLDPILSTQTDPTNLLGSFVTGLLFNFLPGLLFSTFNLTFTYASLITKLMQPIAGMDVTDGAPPKESVLVDYISPDPVTTIYRAVKNGHYRVMWVSLLGLGCTSVPIVAGRMFNRLKKADGSYTMILQPTAFYVSFAFLCLYLVAQWFVVPPLQYRAPRVMYNLVDTVSLCYRSHLLECDEFATSAQSDEYDELRAQVNAADRRFQFGMYCGTDGRMHIGFDVTEVRLADGSTLRPVDPFAVGMTKQDKRRIRALKREIRRSKRAKIIPTVRVIPANGTIQEPLHQEPDEIENVHAPSSPVAQREDSDQIQRRVTVVDTVAPTRSEASETALATAAVDARSN